MYGKSLMGWRMIVFSTPPISIPSFDPPIRKPVTQVSVPVKT
jgi:hypothetical protein